MTWAAWAGNNKNPATLHTAAKTSRWSVQHLVVTFICLLLFFFFFSCVLHSHSRWDKQMRFAPLCLLSWNVPVTHADKNGSLNRLSLSAGVPTFYLFFLLFHMHECTTVSKKNTQRFSQIINSAFALLLVLQSGVKFNHWNHKQFNNNTLPPPTKLIDKQSNYQ